MTPTSETVSRRDAAIAAALAGTVVVVLGYASGLGIQAEPVATLTPVQPAAPAPAAPAAPLPEPTPEAVAAPVISPLPVTNTYPVPANPVVPESSEPEPTEPSTEPEKPAGGGAKCTSLLESLPVVGPATVPLTSVLTDFLATTPIIGGLVGPLLATEDPTGLRCLLGTGR